jgi:hypothetical protein
MSNVARLPASDHMTVEQALDYTKKDGLTEVLIIGHDADGDLIIRSSHLSRKDALWLLEQGKLHTLGLDV